MKKILFFLCCTLITPVIKPLFVYTPETLHLGELISKLKKQKDSGQITTNKIIFSAPSKNKIVSLEFTKMIASTIDLPLIYASLSTMGDVTTMTTALALEKLFLDAEQLAENNPSKQAILFIDNIDLLTTSISFGAFQYYFQKLISQKLDPEYWKKQQNDARVILIVGTSNIHRLDKAFLHRFDDKGDMWVLE